MLMRSPLARHRLAPPGFIPPCRPTLAAKVPAGDGWLHELKHDGIRILARKDGPAIRSSEHMTSCKARRCSCAMGLEGIVSKRLTSRYTSGRCRS